MNNGTNGNGNGDTLSRLQEKVKAAEEKKKMAEANLAAERLALAKRKQKDDKKLFGLVGEEVCEAAAKSPELRLMIAQILGGSVTDAAKRRFLDARGYIA
jgi:hypothetical protein